MSSKAGSQDLTESHSKDSYSTFNRHAGALADTPPDEETIQSEAITGDVTPIAESTTDLLANGIHLDEELAGLDDQTTQLSNDVDDPDSFEESSLPPAPPAVDVEFDRSSVSGPDDLPSSHNSSPTSPASSTPVSRASSRLGSSPAAPTPFERRLQARVPSGSVIGRLSSPQFLTTHSRKSSIASQISLSSQAKSETESDPDTHAPWDVVRWNRLRKISSQAFSEAGRRAFGRPTFLTIGASIALGTSKGIILLFDYQQNLKNVVGQGTASTESGAVTSLAISADHSTVASGHANGSIFTWSLSSSAKPFLHIPAVDRSQPKQRSSDGHVINSAVLHVGFLGPRHTALVSADDKGMAFSHLANRGLGPVGRSVKTTRILGRYPDAQLTAPKTHKPSSVLAFAPLPLGNVEQPTDDLGLTALLTPYLLVIVSTTPIAQTFFKSPRIKDIAPHSAVSGCLAWFPAVKLNNVSQNQTRSTSKTKLVYCWSNVLSLLEIDEVETDVLPDPTRRPDLKFTPCGRWHCDEAILAVQWMSRSIIAVLTITQRLIVLNDNPLRKTDSSDLNSKHIYHQDIFSQQLATFVDKDDMGEASMHGVVADAYHMSFKAYKGRLFLLGMNDMTMGTLSNWADRLMALMEAGRPIAAIELSTSYYTGETDKVAIGLPEDDEKRHILVKGKILELLSASFQYIFNDEEHRVEESDMRSVLTHLAKASFAACLSIQETSFLFDEAYEWYANVSMQDVFVYELEQYIIAGKIDLVPTPVLQFILNWYLAHDMGSRLEDMLCTLRTETMDIDHVSVVCRQLHLYDALISVWNRALHDFITPLIDLMSLASQIDESDDSSLAETSKKTESASKIFPYLAYSLTGREYPDGAALEPNTAFKVKAAIYGFIFSGRTVMWPENHGSVVTFDTEEFDDPNHPYLRFLVRHDPLNFMVLLNEVFEDSFLNGSQDFSALGISPEELGSLGVAGTYMNRQRIVNILLEVVKIPDFGIEDTIYLDMFLARSLPKFSQFILLSGTVLRQILIELCINPRQDLREECQLSVEYLLSIYHPPDLLELVPMFVKAGYFRIVKSTYRSRKQYANWLAAHFEDPDDQEAVFTCIGDCLRPGSGLSNRQLLEVKAVLKDHLRDLVEIDVARSATSLEACVPEYLETTLENFEQRSKEQYLFLRAIFEPIDQHNGFEQANMKDFRNTHRDFYVKLMCKHDPSHVADYISLLDSGDLHLDQVLPTLDEIGIVDAAVILLTSDGLGKEAMERLKTHLATLSTALLELLPADSADISLKDQVDRVLDQIQNYAKIGIWMCQHQATTSPTSSSTKTLTRSAVEATEQTLSTPEQLWLDLVDSIVRLSQQVGQITSEEAEAAAAETPQHLPADFNTAYSKDTTTGRLRQIVQQVFTGLLAITTNSAGPTFSPSTPSLKSLPPVRPSADPNNEPPVRFLAVLSCLMTRLAKRSSSISSVRTFLHSIFSAYLFESSMLELANGLLDKDVFVHVEEAESRRRRGWRPKGQLCEGCKKRAWGAGAGGSIWDDWTVRKAENEEKRKVKLDQISEQVQTQPEATRDKGKAKEDQAQATTQDESEGESSAKAVIAPGEHDALIVFSCTHVFHARCLAKAHPNAVSKQDDAGHMQYQCPLCT